MQFAAHVLCVLSSSLPLGPRDVESATKSIAAVTSNRHGQPIVVRHLDKAASVEGGLAATIVLAGYAEATCKKSLYDLG